MHFSRCIQIWSFCHGSTGECLSTESHFLCIIAVSLFDLIVFLCRLYTLECILVDVFKYEVVAMAQLVNALALRAIFFVSSQLVYLI